MTSAEPGPALHLAGVYRRDVGASLDRIWENVFDWEHLDHLHESSFAACNLLAWGEWGWRMRLIVAGGDAGRAQTIELRADRPDRRYVTTTTEGAGAGTEIRVSLLARAPHLTAVTVEFHVPESRPERLAAIGLAYVAAYRRLWDEDEAMMRARERALAQAAPKMAGPSSIELGSEAEVRANLPLSFALGGERYRLVDVDGALVAHAVVCPHWLGPLDEAPIVDGAVQCPWHGYRFDIRTGACLSGQRLSLGAAPAITTSNGHVRAHAVAGFRAIEQRPEDSRISAAADWAER